MQINSFGKAGQSVVVLLPDRDMDPEVIHAPLAELDKTYQLLTIRFGPSDTPESCADELGDYLLRNCVGRIWGAYGLRFGADVLSRTISRRDIFVRTVVLDSAGLPDSSFPGAFSGELWCWMRHRARSAKKAVEAMRKGCPKLHTLTLKKLKSKQEYWLVRPDKMAKRLKKTFGTARVISLTTVMDENTEKVWNKVLLRPNGKASRRLTERKPLFRLNEEHVQILEGKAPGVSHWSHMTRLKPLDGDRTEYTDQVEYAAGVLDIPVGLWAQLYLKKGQSNRKKQK